ncbi:Zinc transporter ZIP9 [Ceratocystis platani]|uniref:Zinc transporter ZIP9 n=1 Tax=Ceratocystis fimbriata f. sp. platani TaxID=88771 RepID=A0A0F8BMZ3_CERFI|nr:Zinc transporter ZIP9 [Ceratocystis platani]
MTVIIPEGIEALTLHAHAHSHSSVDPMPETNPGRRRSFGGQSSVEPGVLPELQVSAPIAPVQRDILAAISETLERREANDDHNSGSDSELPTFSIGFSLISGFLLMFFIDRLPRHATDHLSAQASRDISLDNLGIGLVIHAAADGIAMGASSSTENTKLGFIIFLAILVHKAPAAFGLTTVLLRQGVSKYAARGHLLVFSVAAPCGALGTWLLIHLLGGGRGMQGTEGHYWTGMLLLFSAGTFLYVAMHAMQEETSPHESGSATANSYPESPHQRKRTGLQMRDTLATAGGMLLPLLTQIGHHSH